MLLLCEESRSGAGRRVSQRRSRPRGRRRRRRQRQRRPRLRARTRNVDIRTKAANFFRLVVVVDALDNRVHNDEDDKKQRPNFLPSASTISFHIARGSWNRAVPHTYNRDYHCAISR